MCNNSEVNMYHVDSITTQMCDLLKITPENYSNIKQLQDAIEKILFSKKFEEMELNHDNNMYDSNISIMKEYAQMKLLDIVQEFRLLIEKGIYGLTPREEEVIKFRHGKDNEHSHTISEVCKEFNISEKRFKQIEFKALHNLSHYIPKRINSLQKIINL